MTASRQETNPWLVALAVILPTFMEVLDTSIASVALPYIAGSLSASNDEATWVLTSYLVANAVVLPISGWCAQRFGRKRFLMTCIVVFTISSFMCGAATSLGMILLARAVQGAGGGALQPMSQAILLESFPEEKRGQAMALFGFGVVVAPILGPTLGGYLTDTYSWRWAFYINIPVGILALLMISRFVHDPDYIRNAKPGKLDGIGLGLLAVWLGCLQIILDKGQEDDWFGATWIRWATFILVVTFIWFVVRMLRQTKPLVDLRVFLKHRNFTLSCLLIALFGGCIYGLITLLPLFYQEILGYTAYNAGLIVSPRGLGAVVAMPIIGILTAKMDNRWLIGGGFLLFAICGVWFAEVNLTLSPWSFVWAIVLSGFGSGMVFVPLSTIAMARLPNEAIGNASGLYNLLRNVGGSIGISVMSTLLARRSQLHQAYLIQHVTPSGREYQEQLQHGTAALAPHLGVMAGAGALGKIYQTLNVQSLLLSYVDDFHYLALISLLCLPVVFFLKKTVGRRGAIHAE